jgi:hypothetical protein
MSRRWTTTGVFACRMLVLLVYAVRPTLAQTPQDDWQFRAYLYGYGATLTGSATFPTGAAANITVDPNQPLHSLNFAFMGAFEARRGPWGLFSDIIYIDASGHRVRYGLDSAWGISAAAVVAPTQVIVVERQGSEHRTLQTGTADCRLIVAGRIAFRIGEVCRSESSTLLNPAGFRPRHENAG